MSSMFSVARERGRSLRRVGGPLPATTPEQVRARVEAELGGAGLPATGMGAAESERTLRRLVADLGLDLTHPFSAAHLQPPVLDVGVAADAMASASNASLDTYDSGPATLAVERWVVDGLARLAGFPAGTGVMTPGGSMSNLLGLLLARDATAARADVDTRRCGVAGLSRPVVICSAAAHFSVQRAAATLGLGEDAVLTLPVDTDQRMDVDALAAALAEPDRDVLAVVATAGTTDVGAVDPLPRVAELCAEHHVWLHVDASYGFAALLSPRLAPLLVGIERADSVAVDLHKLGWLPAATSALLVREPAWFATLDRDVDYLSSRDDVDAGLDGLLGRSLQTTRRADALKVAAAVHAYGTGGLGDMVEACHDLALAAAAAVRSDPRLELVAAPVLTTVLLRHLAGDDDFQDQLRRELLLSGRALVARTRLDGRVVLKLTLLNPESTAEQVRELVGELARSGAVLAGAGRETVA